MVKSSSFVELEGASEVVKVVVSTPAVVVGSSEMVVVVCEGIKIVVPGVEVPFVV